MPCTAGEKGIVSCCRDYRKNGVQNAVATPNRTHRVAAMNSTRILGGRAASDRDFSSIFFNCLRSCPSRFCHASVSLLIVFSLTGLGTHEANAYEPFGVSFSPFIGRQNPATGLVLSSAQIRSRLLPLRGTTKW